MRVVINNKIRRDEAERISKLYKKERIVKYTFGYILCSSSKEEMNFDKEKEYKELCKKFKIEDFIEECRSEKIPFFITACVKNDENGSIYLSDASATGSQNIELKDDHIIKHISVLNGFDTVPHRRNIEMIFEEDN